MTEHDNTLQTEDVQVPSLSDLSGFPELQLLQRGMMEMKLRTKLIRAFIKDNLKEGIRRDYAAFDQGGENKALLKPGAEKILDWHGSYGDPQIFASVRKPEIGLFAFHYRTVVRKRGTDVVIGVGEGTASTYESKYRFKWYYEDQLPSGIEAKTLPFKDAWRDKKKTFKYGVLVSVEMLADHENDVMQIAMKRSYVAACKYSTATSDIFAADYDPDDDDTPTTDAVQKGTVQDGEWKKLIKGRYKSKYGSEDRKSKCGFCEKFHLIEGDDVVLVIGPDDKKLYGDEQCFAKKWMADHPAPKAEAVDEKTGEVTPTSDHPADPEPSDAKDGDPTATISKDQSAAIFASITSAKKTAKQFTTFLAQFDGMYEGKGVSDILASDFTRLMAAWDKAVKADVV